MRAALLQGRQAYVVCSRIGEDDADGGTDADAAGDFFILEDAELAAKGGAAKRGGKKGSRAEVPETKSVLQQYAELSTGPLGNLRVGLLHGRLPSDEKDAGMRDFGAGNIDVLVATSVIEVGVDVPNATVMVIVDADRFGVSQLHQLRGRVGRGGHQGLCLLITDSRPGSQAMMRLDAVAATTDGFALAQLDLQQRREGDVLGVAQSGTASTLRLLSLVDDVEVIAAAQAFARAVTDADPGLAAHPGLARMVTAALANDRVEFLEKS